MPAPPRNLHRRYRNDDSDEAGRIAVRVGAHSAVNDDEVVRDPPAARVRVEDTPDSGFGNVHLATVFRQAISPTEN
jgi:hypothetical protein